MPSRTPDPSGVSPLRVAFEGISGPLRFYDVTMNADLDWFVLTHRVSGFRLEASVQAFRDRLTAGQTVVKDPTLPLEIMADLLPSLCEACGHPTLTATNSGLCEPCQERILHDLLALTEAPPQ